MFLIGNLDIFPLILPGDNVSINEQFLILEIIGQYDVKQSPPVFSEVGVAESLVFCVMLCRSLFVLLSFLFWPLYCVFFDLSILISPLVSSNFS